MGSLSPDTHIHTPYTVSTTLHSPHTTRAESHCRMFQLCFLLMLLLPGLQAGPASQDTEVSTATSASTTILNGPVPPQVEPCCSSCQWNRFRGRCVRRGGGRCPCRG